MNPKAWIQNSPFRILEKVTQKCLKPGAMGIWLGGRSTGKSACLVQLALDSLLQERGVIHLSLSDRNDHIDQWYEDIFDEMFKGDGAAGSKSVYEHLLAQRVLLAFSLPAFSIQSLRKTMDPLLASLSYKPALLIVDGFDFVKTAPSSLKELQALCEKWKMRSWFAAHEEGLLAGKPLPVHWSAMENAFDLILALIQNKRTIALHQVRMKEGIAPESLGLELDPGTFLLRKA